jgi:hypothetical protein
MNPGLSTRIAAGVTATYLLDVSRRPAPAVEPEPRRTTRRRRSCGARPEDDSRAGRRSARSHGSRPSVERVSIGRPPAIAGSDAVIAHGNGGAA